VDQFGYEWAPFCDAFQPFVEMLGTSIYTFDERGLVSGANFEDPRALEALQWYGDLVAKHHVCPTQIKGDTTLGFTLGKVALEWGGTWRIPGFNDEVGDKFEWAPIPYPTPVKGKNPLHFVLQRPCGAILSTTKHPEEAWLYLKHIAGPEMYYEGLKKYGGSEVPPFDPSMSPLAKETMDLWTSTTPPGKESMNLFLDILTGGHYIMGSDNRVPYGYLEFWAMVDAAWPEVFTGKKTAEEVFKPLNAALTKSLRGE